MQSLWSVLCDECVLECMRLAGVKSKYVCGDASDFEKLCALCRAFEHFEGNREANKIADKMSVLLGRKISVSDIACSDASDLWNEYNEKTYALIWSDKNHNKMRLNMSNIYCDENYKSNVAPISLNDLAEGTDAKLPKLHNLSLYAELFENKFIRPSAYAASLERDRRERGEKYNQDLIITQMIFEAFLADKCRKIQLLLHFHGDKRYISDFLNYAVLRNLTTKIHIVADGSISPREMRELCLLGSNSCFVVPVVCAELFRDAQSLIDYVSELSLVYPNGKIKIVEC